MRQNNAYLLFYQKVEPLMAENEPEVAQEHVVEDDVVVEDLMKTAEQIEEEKQKELQQKIERLEDIEEPAMVKNVPVILH